MECFDSVPATMLIGFMWIISFNPANSPVRKLMHRKIK